MSETELHQAAERNDLSKIKLLLSQGVNVNGRDCDNYTPLHYAAIKNNDKSHWEVFKTLLKNGADPNAQDSSGRTPLYSLCSVENSNHLTVQLFLSFKLSMPM